FQTRPGPKGKTKPPADVVSPPGVYMQGSVEKHGVRRARPAQPKAPGRPHPNCVKSISQFSQLVNILITDFSPGGAALSVPVFPGLAALDVGVVPVAPEQLGAHEAPDHRLAEDDGVVAKPRDEHQHEDDLAHQLDA